MYAIEIIERAVSISWDAIIRWTVLIAAVLIAKAMAAALVTTRHVPMLMPALHDNAAIAAPSRI